MTTKTIFGEKLMLLLSRSMNRQLTCFKRIGKKENLVVFPIGINGLHPAVFCLITCNKEFKAHVMDFLGAVMC